MNYDSTVLVASCDKYADLLSPFSILWRKYWADCPFETVLVTETTPDIEGGGVFDRIIACGTGRYWCDLLIAALDQIKTTYVIMLCDDYFLTEPVNTKQILKRLDEARQFNVANLRMIPSPRPQLPFQGDLGEYKKNTAYCIATQAGFWNREFLKRIARGKTIIWDFERRGSFEVADEPRPILGTYTKEFPFLDVVHKGYWEEFGVELLKKNGINYDFTVRGRPPFRIRVKEGIKKVIFHITPKTLLVRVQNFLNSLTA